MNLPQEYDFKQVNKSKVENAFLKTVDENVGFQNKLSEEENIR